MKLHRMALNRMCGIFSVEENAEAFLVTARSIRPTHHAPESPLIRLATFDPRHGACLRYRREDVIMRIFRHFGWFLIFGAWHCGGVGSGSSTGAEQRMQAS